MEILEIDFRDNQLVERYDRLFEECPNAFIQQSTYWCNVIKDLGPDKPIFLLYSDAGIDIAGLPLYIYEHALGNILTSVPQAGPLGGIFHREDFPKEKIGEIYKCLLHKAVEIAKRYDCITLTIITNPFRDDIDFYKRYLLPDFVFENFTQYITLTSVFEGEKLTLRDYNIRSNMSRNIKKSKELGYSIKFCENLEQLKSWYQIHCQRHTELGAIPLEYCLFENMFYDLSPRNKAQLILVEYRGEIAGGCFYIYHKKIMDVFMLSMNPKYTKPSANYINTEYSLYWANSLGIAIYNWQSSQNRQCGVYNFKRQWGSVDRPYYFVTKLLCNLRDVQEIGADNIKQQYKWHYVIPYGAFTEGPDKKYFKKA